MPSPLTLFIHLLHYSYFIIHLVIPYSLNWLATYLIAQPSLAYSLSISSRILLFSRLKLLASEALHTPSVFLTWQRAPVRHHSASPSYRQGNRIWVRVIHSKGEDANSIPTGSLRSVLLRFLPCPVNSNLCPTLVKSGALSTFLLFLSLTLFSCPMGIFNSPPPGLMTIQGHGTCQE